MLKWKKTSEKLMNQTKERNATVDYKMINKT